MPSTPLTARKNRSDHPDKISFARAGWKQSARFFFSIKTGRRSLFLVFHHELKHFADGYFQPNMRTGTQHFLRFLQSWLVNTLAVALAVMILRGHIHCETNVDLLLAALLLGILNAFVRPILMLIALPLLIFTLGLFTLVINALLLYFVGYLLKPDFYVDSFGYAFLGALIISVISIALNVLTGNARVTVQRRTPPPKKSDDDDKPVIDV
jgi:putative membrane protein